MELSIKWIVEFVAVLTGLIYPYLAGKNKPSCWLFAIISASAYVYINYATQLYFFAILQFLYVVLAVYGWVIWNRPEQKYQFRFIKYHTIWILFIGSMLSVILAFVAQLFTNQRMPYLDAFNFIFALVASIMIIKKIIEAWLYLTVLNLISIYIYFQTNLYLSIILYVFLTFLAINAFKDWLKKYKLNKLQIK